MCIGRLPESRGGGLDELCGQDRAFELGAQALLGALEGGCERVGCAH